jgi:hypothetical protein
MAAFREALNRRPAIMAGAAAQLPAQWVIE